MVYILKIALPPSILSPFFCPQRILEQLCRANCSQFFFCYHLLSPPNGSNKTGEIQHHIDGLQTSPAKRQTSPELPFKNPT